MGFSPADCTATRPEGRKSAQNKPCNGNMVFPLDSGPDFGESRSCDRTNFPGFDRHHGPPLAGFAVSGAWFSRWLKERRGESVRQFASLPENQSTVESLRATPKML
jgi:hypothetical protein